MTPLLTPQNVADLLQIPIGTVYKRKNTLGGFYPAGLKVLRFNPGVIYAIMEGRQNVALSVSVSRETPQQTGIRNQGRGKGGNGDSQARIKKSSPADNRHGF